MRQEEEWSRYEWCEKGLIPGEQGSEEDGGNDWIKGDCLGWSQGTGLRRQ